MPKRHHIVVGLLGFIAAYVVSVGAVAPIIRQTGDSGHLQWLPSVPGAVWLLNTYQWPADQLSRVGAVQCLFEISSSLWWGLLNPPDTTP